MPNLIRMGRFRRAGKGDMLAQVRFISKLFGIARKKLSTQRTLDLQYFSQRNLNRSSEAILATNALIMRVAVCIRVPNKPQGHPEAYANVRRCWAGGAGAVPPALAFDYVTLRRPGIPTLRLSGYFSSARKSDGAALTSCRRTSWRCRWRAF